MAEDERRRPPGPRTRPTGRPPAGATPAKAPERPPAVDAQTLKAWRVKVVYMQERGRFESIKAGRTVPYEPPPDYDGRPANTIEGKVVLRPPRRSEWQALVDWCEAKKVPPEAYVRQCFACLPVWHKNAPEPRQLMTARHLAVWAATKDKRVEGLKLELSLQRAYSVRQLVLRQRGYGEAEEVARVGLVADGAAAGLSPLFRYCFAVSCGTPALLRIARRLKAQAVLQFEAARAGYKKAWADVLPPGFAAESKRIYPYLLAKLWGRRKEARPADE